ncbi:uncharacterized protein JN550_004547 [Neoarthrinium moseri]|uniref:uncharacterized protein n=1 Tax=Neoarthrinium moseri TaxID=1658444 RepID=UPI001FDD970A|nr:uncharacterized protein JN550_004547 [Neoarthrinium moseri]KAI1871553.1 hypothetical protein JN550_004547 [Neoarthrinium moseri]
MSLRLFTVSALLAVSSLVSATKEVAASEPKVGTDTVHGCYSSLGNLVLNATSKFNTQGLCATACRGMDKVVGASFSESCYCGDKYPPKNTLVDDSECTEPCPGFGDEACGGLDTFTVYNTGVRVSVADEANTTDSSATASSGPDATSSQSVATVSGVVVTVTPSASAGPSSGGSNTVGIAVGSVVGIIAVAAIAGGLFFMMKRRRNREIEDEHRRNAAVNAFIAGGKPPSSSGGLSISDQRLDPVMAQRRMSSGSIADDQDYSRRILRVTNA